MLLSVCCVLDLESEPCVGVSPDGSRECRMVLGPAIAFGSRMCAVGDEAFVFVASSPWVDAIEPEWTDSGIGGIEGMRHHVSLGE